MGFGRSCQHRTDRDQRPLQGYPQGSCHRGAQAIQIQVPWSSEVDRLWQMGLHPLVARGLRRHAQVAPSDDRRRRRPISPRPRTAQGLDEQIQQVQLGTTTLMYFPIDNSIPNYALDFSLEKDGVCWEVFVQPR